MSTIARTLAAAGLVLATAVSAAAQDTSTEHVKALIAQAMAQQAQPPATTSQVMTQPGSTFRTPGPVVDLTVQDAVGRAMDKNIEIGVARITPRLTDFTIASLEANYRVNLTSATSNNRRTSLPNRTTDGSSVTTTTTTQAWSAGVSKNFWRGGGNYTLNWTNSRVDAPGNSTNFRNPTLNAGLAATVTQPLWRGFKIDNTRATIRTTHITQQNDELALSATTMNTQASVKNAYWDLVNAIQSVEAAQNSFDIAARLVNDNQARVEIGTLAPIDIVTAQAEQANRRLALVQAHASVRTTELALKRLIVSGTEDPLWTASINPVDRPAATPEPINLEAAVATALANRTDMRQSLNNLKISDINLENQVDATKPQLNLNFNYGLTGIGGPNVQRNVPDPITGAISTVVTQSGYLDALRNISSFDAPNWTLGVNFAYPIGRSAQEATVARTKLSLDQTKANVKALELQIATEVTNAALNVQSTLESVQATGVARELALKRLEAAQSKFEQGMATNYEVVQSQRDFTDARNAELRALLNYRKALVNFETVQSVGTRGVAAAGGGGGN